MTKKLPAFNVDDYLGDNAVMILVRWRNAAREAGWTEAEIDAVVHEATAGPYNHLCDTFRKNSEGGNDEG